MSKGQLALSFEYLNVYQIFKKNDSKVSFVLSGKFFISKMEMLFDFRNHLKINLNTNILYYIIL